MQLTRLIPLVAFFFFFWLLYHVYSHSTFYLKCVPRREIVHSVKASSTVLNSAKQSAEDLTHDNRSP